MSNNKDFKVKNGIQPTVYHEAVGTVVSDSVTVGYADVSTWSYDGVSFSVSGQDSQPRGLSFNNDGTKMYISGDAFNKIFQYSLSTAFDITTASYNSVSSGLHGAAVKPKTVLFNTSGTRMFILCGTNDRVYQYDLSTAFDVSTSSYNSVSANVQSQDTFPEGLAFNNDGTKMYMIGNDTNSVFQYSLSTAFDLSTTSYDTVSFNITSQEADPRNISFNSDGTKMYMVGNSNDTVHQYSLSTAFDISTASYDNSSLILASQDSDPHALAFNNDGTKMYMIGIGSDTIHQYTISSTTITATLDLSTGSVFDYTPTSDVQVTLTNPAASGTSSGATLLLGAEEATGVGSTFSTTLYTGTSGSQTITNGIDLAGDGGLVWLKGRIATNHHLIDTERGSNKFLISNATNAEGTSPSGADVTSFNSDGFSFGTYYNNINYTGNNYVSWTFKKQTKFFDIITYTGDGVSGRTVNHNLGSTPGCIMIKSTNDTQYWYVYHKELGNGFDIFLNATNAKNNANTWNYTDPTSTDFTLSSARANVNGNTYVAYLFAHDTDASSIIKCGSYTGNGSTTGPEVNLGWQPQWVMVKSASIIADWTMYDNVRGVEAGTAGSKYLHPNKTDAEATRGFNFLSNGFQPRNTGTDSNSNGATYIYMAIRNPFIPTITYPTSLQWSGGTAPTSPAIGETDVLTFNTTDGGTTYQAVQAIDGAK
jgi:hypothetical protein